jgi:uncharacterized protein
VFSLNFQPTPKNKRISIVDVLRGIAVFGIFLVNVKYLSTPDQAFEQFNLLPKGDGSVNQAIRLMIEAFFSGKFYPILSLLFGFGFYIIMQRAEQRGQKPYRFFFRRMLILFAFGALHMTFSYAGDVLHAYALLGCLLMLFYRRKTKTILTWSVSIMAISLLMFGLQFIQPKAELQANNISNYALAEHHAAISVEITQKGNYLEWLPFHLQDTVLPNLTLEPITFPSIFMMMLLGFYFGRIGVFQRLNEYVGMFRKMRNIFGAVSLLTVTLLLMVRLHYMNIGAFEGSLAQVLVYGFGIYMSLFYLSSIVLLYQSQIGQKLLKPFQYVGKMTLTNYLLQSVISIILFVGLGLFAQLNYAMILAVCLCVFIMETGLSLWCMKRFTYGPMEWLWRRLTYGSLQKSGLPTQQTSIKSS